ncbi:MAG: hypothetical protein AAFO77_11845, partial [Pseudomonadota bacterium]
NDTVRYQFGFTVDVQTHPTINEALGAASSATNAIVVMPTPSADDGPWWADVGGPDGLSVMARLPVVPVPFESVDTLALAPQLSDPVPFEWRVYVVSAKAQTIFADWADGTVLATHTRQDGNIAALIALAPGGKVPADVLDIRAAGGYFAPLEHQTAA